MDQNKIDFLKISKLTEKQAKAELYSALTVIRKVVTDVPEKKRKASTSYNKEGHMRCVNYLKGFTNIWEKNHGS